jgi:tRNA-specific adenosine deaminase 2
MAQEAIMMLRNFYVRENEHAPVPRKKVSRVVKPINHLI